MLNRKTWSKHELFSIVLFFCCKTHKTWNFWKKVFASCYTYFPTPILSMFLFFPTYILLYYFLLTHTVPEINVSSNGVVVRSSICRCPNQWQRKGTEIWFIPFISFHPSISIAIPILWHVLYHSIPYFLSVLESYSCSLSLILSIHTSFRWVEWPYVQNLSPHE